MNPQITIDSETGLFTARLDDGTPKGTVVRAADKTTLKALLDHRDAKAAEVAKSVDRIGEAFVWLVAGVIFGLGTLAALLAVTFGL